MNARERAILFGKDIKPATLDESALAYAVAHGGTPEPTYETVAEIPVGEMTKQEGLEVYAIEIRGTDLSDELKADSLKIFANQYENLFFNDVAYPLERISVTGADYAVMYSHNFDIEKYEPIESGKPSFLLGIILDENDYSAISSIQIGSTEDLSSSVVNLIAESSAEPSSDLYVTGKAAWVSETPTVSVSDLSATVEEIFEAKQNKRNIIIELTDSYNFDYDLILSVASVIGNSSSARIYCFSCNPKLSQLSQPIAYVLYLTNEVGGNNELTKIELAKKSDVPSIPAYDTTEDLGKVLTVTANGLAWVKP